MTALMLLVALAAAAPCDLAAPADAPFAEAIARAGLPTKPVVQVVVEVHASDAEAGWIRDVAEALSARGLRGVFVVRPGDPALPLLAGPAARGHEVAFALDRVAASEDVLGEVRRLKRQARDAKKVLGDRPRVAVAAIPRRTAEAALGLAGFRVILEEAGPAVAAPRTAVAFEGQIADSVVLPSGPYHGACGTDPLVGPFTPAAADRATIAIRTAAASGAYGVVRVALDGRHAGAADARVLARWLDEVVLPAGVAVSPPSEARLVALSAPPPDPAAVGRFVATDDVRAAAEALRDVHVVPRELPGGLTPTEAWLAFALVLAGEGQGDLVKLSDLGGPRSNAGTTLSGPVTVPRERVVATAQALLGALPEDVPAAVPVDGHLLTASELLLLFASAVREDDAPNTRPVGVPEPNADGLGWGRAD